jgi:hypothetical protein
MATHIYIAQQEHADAARRLGFTLRQLNDGSWHCQISSERLSEEDIEKAKNQILREAMKGSSGV